VMLDVVVFFPDEHEGTFDELLEERGLLDAGGSVSGEDSENEGVGWLCDRAMRFGSRCWSRRSTALQEDAESDRVRNPSTEPRRRSSVHATGVSVEATGRQAENGSADVDGLGRCARGGRTRSADLRVSAGATTSAPSEDGGRLAHPEDVALGPRAAAYPGYLPQQ
jgi:hypothetical protein